MYQERTFHSTAVTLPGEARAAAVSSRSESLIVLGKIQIKCVCARVYADPEQPDSTCLFEGGLGVGG